MQRPKPVPVPLANGGTVQRGTVRTPTIGYVATSTPDYLVPQGDTTTPWLGAVSNNPIAQGNPQGNTTTPWLGAVPNTPAPVYTAPQGNTTTPSSQPPAYIAPQGGATTPVADSPPVTTPTPVTTPQSKANWDRNPSTTPSPSVIVPTSGEEPVVRDNPYARPTALSAVSALPYGVSPYEMPTNPFSGSFVPTPQMETGAPAARYNPYAMQTEPVPRAEGSPEEGETGAAYGNPAMRAAGEKMRARKALEQVNLADQRRKADVLDRANMRRDTPETLEGPPSDGPKTLDEAAGLDPKVTNRTAIIPNYSRKDGLTN